MMDNGYDDIDFITSVTEEELLEIGITKKGWFPWLLLHCVLYYFDGCRTLEAFQERN